MEEIEKLKEVLKFQNNEIKILTDELENLKQKSLNKNKFDTEENLKRRFLNKNFDNEYFKPIYLKNPEGMQKVDLHNRWNSFKHDLDSILSQMTPKDNKNSNKKKKILKKRK